MKVSASSVRQLQREALADAPRTCVIGTADVGNRQIARDERSPAADAVERLLRYGTDRHQAIRDARATVLALLFLVQTEGCLCTES